jgi:hypothetical protein
MKIGQLQLMIPSRKDDEIYLFLNSYEASKGPIIQDFAAHCAMENEQMAQSRKFQSKSESDGEIMVKQGIFSWRKHKLNLTNFHEFHKLWQKLGPKTRFVGFSKVRNTFLLVPNSILALGT